MKGLNFMPYDFTYPIDDDTLFILLSLRYLNNINISVLPDIYKKRVNYDETFFKKDNNKLNIKEFTESVINWITKEFSVEWSNDKTKIKGFNSDKLKNFLDTYFVKFRTYKNYYHSEAEHKDIFVKFISENYKDIISWEKSFLYRLTNDKQYKMVQYIGYLMHKGILDIAHPQLFTFNNDIAGYEKVVNIKFVDGYDIKKFKRGRKDRGLFYIFTDDKKVYYDPTGRAIDITENDLLALLRECIEQDLTEITPDTFRYVRKRLAKNKKELTDSRIVRYFSRLNNHLKDITGFFEHNFIYSPHRNGKWIVDLEITR